MTASWQIPGTPSTGDRKQHDPAPDHIEANALLAVQEGQLAEAQHAIDKMLPSERRRLARACVTLHELLTTA